MKARLIILLLFVASMSALAAGAFLRAGRAALIPPAVIRPAVVRCAPLREAAYTMTESFYGLIEAKAQVMMSFQIAGRIETLGPSKAEPWRENDAVRPGDVLATVEPLRYQAQVQQAEAKMEEAKASMAQADAQIATARAQLAEAQRELDRVTKLREAGAVNVRELDKAQVAVQLTQAQYDRAEAMLASARASYDLARAAATVANVSLADATLRAPMAATVAAVPVEVGQTVQPGQPIIRLVDLDKVRLVVGVVESKLPLLHEGQRVNVEVSALAAQALREMADETPMLQGVVAVVPPASDPTTGVFNVEVELDNADNLLKPGMVGKAVVTVGERRGVSLPADAVVRQNGKLWAYVVGKGFDVGLDLGPLGKSQVRVATPVARRVPVDPIAFDHEQYLVAQPPGEADQLVIEGQSRLTDGQPVVIVE